MSDKKRIEFNNKLEASDFYINEDGFMVFTASYHLKRGYCCKNGCKHCPYGFKKSLKTF
jgi:hypothetical protein